MVATLPSSMPVPVRKYLRENWFNCSAMWANFGRKFFHEGHDTNNLVERYYFILYLIFMVYKIHVKYMKNLSIVKTLSDQVPLNYKKILIYISLQNRLPMGNSY